MCRKRIMLGIIMVLGLIAMGSYSKLNDESGEVNDENVNSSALSIMLESDVSGEYELSKDNSWPSEGYVFNEEKTYCENEGEITYDTSTHKIAVITDKTDKCYAYFDKPLALSNYIKGLYTNQGENGLYLHDETLDLGAEDGSYRYAGADPSNYVCFGSDEEACPNDNLYRIIGVFGGNVKLIKADYVTSALLGIDGDYAMNGSEEALGLYEYRGQMKAEDIAMYYGDLYGSESKLDSINLNINFINNIGSAWAEKIEEANWNFGEITTSDVTAKTFYDMEKTSTYQAKIGLMTPSEYGYATIQNYWSNILSVYNSTIIKDDNWLYLGYNEMTNYYKFSTSPLVVNFDGAVNEYGWIYDEDGNPYSMLRPSFYLRSSVTLIGGEGTKTSPYRIN